MARILITSGPTRQYLDPVRYLTNASSGRMGVALTKACLEMGHQVVVVTGPVHVSYPPDCQLIRVVTTQEMLEACRDAFTACDGLIGAAAPCDFQPAKVAEEKVTKTGHAWRLELNETPDILATLGQQKRLDQWMVGFALETTDAHARAYQKLHKKSCDLIVLNAPQAIESETMAAQLIDRQGQVVGSFQDRKEIVAHGILAEIQRRCIELPS